MVEKDSIKFQNKVNFNKNNGQMSITIPKSILPKPKAGLIYNCGLEELQENTEDIKNGTENR